MSDVSELIFKYCIISWSLLLYMYICGQSEFIVIDWRKKRRYIYEAYQTRHPLQSGIKTILTFLWPLAGLHSLSRALISTDIYRMREISEYLNDVFALTPRVRWTETTLWYDLPPLLRAANLFARLSRFLSLASLFPRWNLFHFALAAPLSLHGTFTSSGLSYALA